MYMWKLYYDGGWLCDSHVDRCFEEKPFMKTKMKPWKKQTTKSKVTSIIGNQMVVNMTEIYLILK